jgi:hypothetical protein
MTFVRPAAAVLLLATSACAPRFDLTTEWTIDGNPPATFCPAFVDPQVRFTVENQDKAGGAVTEEVTTAACLDGTSSLQVASFASVLVDLVDGDTVFGTAGPFNVAPGTGSPYIGDPDEGPLRADIDIERGRLQATLTVLGQSCGDAGVDSFTVTLMRNTGPLGNQILVDGETVACSGGAAVFSFSPVEIGSTYEVVASAGDFRTDDTGEGILISLPLNLLTVDLSNFGD